MENLNAGFLDYGMQGLLALIFLALIYFGLKALPIWRESVKVQGQLLKQMEDVERVLTTVNERLKEDH